GEEGVPEEVLHPRPPGVEPSLLEDLDEARDRKRALGRRDRGERVEGHPRPRRRIAEDGILPAPPGEPSLDAVHEIAMGVDDRAAVAFADILPEERLKEGGLPRAGLPDEVHMAPAVGATDTEETADAAIIGAAEEREVLGHGCHCRGLRRARKG